MENTTIKDLMERLAIITVGHTTVIRGVPVTRWTKYSFELGTWSKHSVALTTAAEKLMEVE